MGRVYDSFGSFLVFVWLDRSVSACPTSIAAKVITHAGHSRLTSVVPVVPSDQDGAVIVQSVIRGQQSTDADPFGQRRHTRRSPVGHAVCAEYIQRNHCPEMFEAVNHLCGLLGCEDRHVSVQLHLSLLASC